MESASFVQILFCDFLYIVAFFSLYKAFCGQHAKNIKVLFCVLSMVLVCIYNYITADYFHYLGLYDLQKAGLLINPNIEPIYLDIFDFASSYFIFRLIVWGTAVLFLLLTFKVTKVDFAVVLFLFVIRNFIYFSYPRVSLSMAMLYCGLALLSKIKDYKFVFAIFGGVLIWSSLYFHKTAIFGVGVVIASIPLLRQNRYTFLITLLLIPIIAFALRYFVVDLFLDSDFSESELMLDKGQKYFALGSSSNRYNSFTKNLADIIWRIPYYIVIIMYAKLTISNQFNSMPVQIKLFTNAAVISIFIAILFLVIGSIGNFVVFYRFINFAMIPSVVFVTYCYSNNVYPGLVKAFFYFSVAGVTINLLFKTTVALL